MEFGLFSNARRFTRTTHDAWEEDLKEIAVADSLGFNEAWISEHGSLMTFNAPDQMPCADLLICKALSLTKQIKMGPGIRPLPFFHPLQVATDCAVCDHLADGRYMAGFGLGLTAHQHEPRGKLPGPPREMALESIDLILKAWEATEPFDWNGKYWQGKNWKIIPKPLTKPRMDVGLACSRSDATLDLAARKGFFPMLTWHQRPAELAKMAQTYLDSPYDDIKPTRERIRVCRYLYVSDSKASARRELKDADVGAAAKAHGSHLPLKTDALTARALAQRLLERVR